MGISQDQLDRVIALAKAYGATRLILFGSAATEPEQTRDLDLACEGVPGWSLYELGARLEEELQIPLGLVPLTPPTQTCPCCLVGPWPLPSRFIVGSDTWPFAAMASSLIGVAWLKVSQTCVPSLNN